MRKLGENIDTDKPERNAEKAESFSMPQVSSVLGINIHYTDTGKAIQTVKNGEGKTELRVNQERFASPELAMRAAVEEGACLQNVKDALEKDPKAYLQARNKKGLLGALKLAGIGKLKMQAPQLAHKITGVNPNFSSIKQEFDYACSQYVLTGNIPSTVSEGVQTALRSLKTRGRKNALDFIASGIFSLGAVADMYEKYILSALEQAKKLSIEEGQTNGDEYRPQTGLEEGEAMDESQIENKVEPFYGGYYRGRAYRYDPQKLQIVEDSTSKQTFSPDIGEDIEKLKKYTFTGVFDPSKENILHLPYKALPLPESLDVQESQQDAGILIGSIKTRVFGGQKGVWQIMRDSRGVFSLEAPNTISTKVPFSFDFVLHQTEDNRLNDNPVTTDFETLGGNFDDETNTFLTKIQSQSHLLPEQVAQKVVQFVRKKFTYPEDQNAMNKMNSLYAESLVNIMQTICSHGIADCHWSNIFAGELIKKLEVAQRIPAGFYVQKDPRFDFAALAGTGHAWSEVWNGEEWKRFDATPPKENEEQDDSEEEQEDSEGDYGDSADAEEQEELSLEEIEELFKELLGQQEEEEKEPEQPKMFEGVPFAKWQEVERFVNQVNGTPIPAEMSIRKKPNTLYEEWRALFDLIYRRREIPQQAFRGPVRKSEGDFLDDVVDAYIDTKAGEDDPMGYKKEAKKSKETLEVTEFEDDVVLDLTGSMKQSGAYLEQKKMVLANSFNIMGLNRRLNLTYNKNKMKAPLSVKTHIASFKGTSTTQLHHTRDDEMNEKRLCELYDAFDDTETGMGNMYGALQQYKTSITPELLQQMKKGKLKKVLTVISDGEVNDQSGIVSIISELRSMGVIVQGIGFGSGSETIKVICHDPNDPSATETPENIAGATLARHKLLVKHLKNV